MGVVKREPSIEEGRQPKALCFHLNYSKLLWAKLCCPRIRSRLISVSKGGQDTNISNGNERLFIIKQKATYDTSGIRRNDLQFSG